MYQPGELSPLTAALITGDLVEHKLMPGWRMEIQQVKPCETDAARSKPHNQYRITDPDGNPDWLCAYDVLPVV